MTRVLYTGARGMFTAKVCSWCVSRLGGSAAWATRNTPPCPGCSSARANGAAHSPTPMTMTSNHTCIWNLLIISPPSDSVRKNATHARYEGQCELEGHTCRALDIMLLLVQDGVLSARLRA